MVSTLPAFFQLPDLDVRDRVARSWNKLQTWVLEETEEPDWEAITQENEKYNEQNLLLHNLPREIQIAIFLSSNLDGHEIARLTGVCKRWYRILSDPFVWKQLFERDQARWRTITSVSDCDSSMWEQPQASRPQLTRSAEGNVLIDWKRAYLCQHVQNSRRVTPHGLESKLTGGKTYTYT